MPRPRRRRPHTYLELNEPLKGYLDCFDKATMQVKNFSDDTFIQAFERESRTKKLLWLIAYDVPPNFANLRGIAQKHAEAEEYNKGWNSAIGETSCPAGKSKPKKDMAGRPKQPLRELGEG